MSVGYRHEEKVHKEEVILLDLAKCYCFFQLLLDICCISAKFPFLASVSQFVMKIKITCMFKSRLIQADQFGNFFIWNVIHTYVQQSPSNKGMIRLKVLRKTACWNAACLYISEFNCILKLNKTKLLDTLCV